MMEVSRALTLFALAGLAEIGGGWLMWQWLKVDRPWPIGMFGALVIVSYGVIPTFQNEAHFGRVYAAYGGLFIILALIWGRIFDGFEPDRWDIRDAVICLVGVGVIFFGPADRATPTAAHAQLFVGTGEMGKLYRSCASRPQGEDHEGELEAT